MLIKRIMKNGRKVWVRDVATEMFNKVGEWFKYYVPVVVPGMIIITIAAIMEVIW
jgi:hypothetical protein